MNGIDPSGEECRERWLAPSLRSAVEEHQVVVLTGARQVGKSTLLRHEAPVAWRRRRPGAGGGDRIAVVPWTMLWGGGGS